MKQKTKRATFGQMLEFMRQDLRESQPYVALWLRDWLEMYYKCTTRQQARALIRKFHKQAQRIPVVVDLYRVWRERCNDMERNRQDM